MGTTRIKVIDLSSDKQEIKTSRKHARLASPAKRAEKLAGTAKIKKTATTESTEKEHDNTEKKSVDSSKSSASAMGAKKPEITEELPTSDVEKGREDTEIEQVPSSEPSVSSSKSSVPSVVARKTHSTRHAGKKYKDAKGLVENKPYAISDALTLLPKTSITKFDPSVEIHLSVVDKNIKGSVTFPHSSGDTKKRELKHLIFTDKRLTINDKPIIWGNEKTIEEIESGKLKPKRDFDAVISTPKFMPSLAKIAKILGPVGLMPNPKNGTVTDDIQKAIQGSTDDGYRFKTDPNAPVMHVKIGKLSQGEKELQENLKALILAIGSAKIRKATLTSTMGPGIRLDITSA